METKMKYIGLFTLTMMLFACGSKEEIQPKNQDIKELVFASGELEWDNAYNLTAQTDGILTNLSIEIGSQVEKGKIVATIDNKNNQINTLTAKEQLSISNENMTSTAPAVQQLQQTIQIAENKYNQDKIQAERYKRLFDSQSVAKVECENMELNAKNSLANLNALKKQLLQIEQQAKQQQIASKGQAENFEIIQNYNKLITTEPGTVIKKFKSNGDYVKKGDIIATIANDKQVEAVLNVDENNIGKVKIGQLVFIRLNSSKNKVYNGKISEILSAFDEQTQSFICKVTFNQKLNSSLYGTQLEANILVGEKKNALLIPRSYLGFGNKVSIKGRKEPVVIQTGIISTDYVEVVSGITKSTVLVPLKP